MRLDSRPKPDSTTRFICSAPQSIFIAHLFRDSLEDGRRVGNIIVNGDGTQNNLDTHRQETFAQRIENYIVGKNPIVLSKAEEIEKGRSGTTPILQSVLGKTGDSPFDVIGRCSKLDENQTVALRNWLQSLKVHR